MRLARALAMSVALAGASFGEARGADGDKVRVVVFTDGEGDDQDSMVRFLLYTNDFDVEAIIHDQHGTNRACDPAWIFEKLDLFERVRPNLIAHDPRYPTAQALRDVVRRGCAMDDAASFVATALMRPDPRPIWIDVWGPSGGLATLPRVMERLKASPADELTPVLTKLRINAVGGQTLKDGKWNAWFPDKIVTISDLEEFKALAYRDWGKLEPGASEWTSDAFQDRWIVGAGPLGASYHRGGTLEGDTPSFLYHVPTGLRSTEDPSYGGWGGRFVPSAGHGLTWMDVQEDGWWTKPITRWFEAIQNDFAARLAWSTTSSRDKANHAPQVLLGHAEDLEAKPGAAVALSAAGTTDPDGQELRYRWWQYAAADPYPGTVTIDHAASANASFVFPADGIDQSVHVVLEVTDTGSPPMTRYRRVIVTGRANPRSSASAAPDGGASSADGAAPDRTNGTGGGAGAIDAPRAGAAGTRGVAGRGGEAGANAGAGPESDVAPPAKAGCAAAGADARCAVPPAVIIGLLLLARLRRSGSRP